MISIITASESKCNKEKSMDITPLEGNKFRLKPTSLERKQSIWQGSTNHSSITHFFFVLDSLI
jgi:hypothetical protein